MGRLFTVLLRPVLPECLFEQLDKDKFETIRHALRRVFSDYLGEAAQ